MLNIIAQGIKNNGEFQTHLGGKEESVYVLNGDVLVIREDGQGTYSIWKPTDDVLVTREELNNV